MFFHILIYTERNLIKWKNDPHSFACNFETVMSLLRAERNNACHAVFVSTCTLRPRPHQSVFKRKRSCFAPFSKKPDFVHTYRFRIVFARAHNKADQKRSHMVGSVRHFEFSRSSGLAPGRVYLKTNGGTEN